jgi:hypothetical protein
MSLHASWLRAAVAFVLALSWLCASGRASAHPAPGSVAFVDFTASGARIEQDVPIEELELALHRPLGHEGEPAPAMVQRHRDMLRAYAGAHLRVTSVGPELPWSVEVVDVTGHASDDGPRALFHFVVHAPKGEASGSIRLDDDIVLHEVASHYTTVHVRSSFPAGVETNPPRLVGTLHAGRSSITLTRDGSFWRGLRSVVGLGMAHIAAGTDHVMFLFALVLAAPLAPSGSRWKSRRTTGDTLRELARVVTAFTIGHSATLALGALAGVELSSAIVEPAIAASILVTAVHALRPVFPRREALVAGVFGLVHGLALGSSLAHHDLGRAQAAWTLLGFNVGVELAQLGLLFLVVPWLLILARTRAYDLLRIGGAGAAAVLAAAWFLERTAGFANPTTGLVVWLSAHPTILLVTLASTALLARAADRGRRGTDAAGRRLTPGCGASHVAASGGRTPPRSGRRPR